MIKSFVAEMFGGSPIRPLQRHMAQVESCAKDLLPFIDAALRGDWEEGARLQARIAEQEGEADKLKHELRRRLPMALFMAVDRRDVLEILAMQDKVANKAKDIAGLMLGRRMRVPAELAEDFRLFVECGIAACAQARAAIEELDELLDTGFRGREVHLLEGMLEELDRIENESDRLQVRIRAQLLALEAKLPPVDVIFTYQIIDWIGDLADRAQRVGSRLQLIVAR